MIAGSTVGAVAAVLSYHPAASGSIEALVNTPVDTTSPVDVQPSVTPTPSDSATAAPTSTPTPAPTSSPTKSKKPSTQPKSAPAKSSANATAGTPATQDTQPTPSTSSTPSTPSTPAPKVAKDQTVTGATAQTRWGPVQVQITVKDGKIVDAVGLQYPNGDRRSQWISEQAIPWLVEETLAEQIADVQIIGGATYTTMGWRQSLASAMQKAGL